MATVRARFAPSPTGELHVGSVRTALLNWLFVRANSGRLLLRIDDTDRERSSAALEARIIDDLKWLGLDWDDGPVHQSERGARYTEALHELPTVDRDGAYVFDGRVIARADGSALYHLATAVDDIDDDMTHVLRGRDHTSNTELQRAIIIALGHEPPEYIHAPLLTFDGAKISKRVGAGAATVTELREAGYPALAVLNALALSLADFGTEEVMLSLDEMAARFDLARLHTADSHFDVDKLRWVSGQHIRAMDDSAFAGELAERGTGSLPPAALIAAKTGGSTVVECAEVGRALIEPPIPDGDALEAIAAPATAAALAILERLDVRWPVPLDESDAAFTELKAALKAEDLKLGVALHGLRALLTGRAQGPEFHLILATLTDERIAAARATLSA